jgi:hypothetical protein
MHVGSKIGWIVFSLEDSMALEEVRRDSKSAWKLGVGKDGN